MRLLLFSLFALLMGCHDTPSTGHTDSHKATTIRATGNGYALLRKGQPYFIEGAGGVRYFDRLKACGGNSVRVWDDNDAGRILGDAQRLGLTVMLGLWVQRETEGSITTTPKPFRNSRRSSPHYAPENTPSRRAP